jgi:hypothetical protein
MMLHQQQELEAHGVRVEDARALVDHGAELLAGVAAARLQRLEPLGEGRVMLLEQGQDQLVLAAVAAMSRMVVSATPFATNSSIALRSIRSRVGVPSRMVKENE